MSAPEHQITAGFMPLLDSVLLVTALEKGFAASEGVSLQLVRETSWANIRGRIAVGHFEPVEAPLHRKLRRAIEQIGFDRLARRHRIARKRDPEAIWLDLLVAIAARG